MNESLIDAALTDPAGLSEMLEAEPDPRVSSLASMVLFSIGAGHSPQWSETVSTAEYLHEVEACVSRIREHHPSVPSYVIDRTAVLLERMVLQFEAHVNGPPEKRN